MNGRSRRNLQFSVRTVLLLTPLFAIVLARASTWIIATCFAPTEDVDLLDSIARQNITYSHVWKDGQPPAEEPIPTEHAANEAPPQRRASIDAAADPFGDAR